MVNGNGLASLSIPVTGTWLISFSIVVSSVAISTGQFVMTNSAFTNIGLTNGSQQATYEGTISQGNGNNNSIQGSLVVNNISGSVTMALSFLSSGNVACLYTYSYFQAVRIA